MTGSKAGLLQLVPAVQALAYSIKKEVVQLVPHLLLAEVVMVVVVVLLLLLLPMTLQLLTAVLQATLVMVHNMLSLLPMHS
jgi:hypothetical protein